MLGAPFSLKSLFPRPGQGPNHQLILMVVIDFDYKWLHYLVSTGVIDVFVAEFGVRWAVFLSCFRPGTKKRR